MKANRIYFLVVCLLVSSSLAVAQESFDDKLEKALGLLKKQTEMAAAAVKGEKIYRGACLPCHGVNGDGKGPYYEALNPKPRNFTTGKFKFRTTSSRSVPTDQDLFKTISKGLPGTFMPAWEDLLSEKDRMALVQYIKTFSKRFAVSGDLIERNDVSNQVPYSRDSILKGRKVYKEMECIKCHGDGGRGDGPSAGDLKDDWGYRIRPADLRKSWNFRGGNSRQDIYHRFTGGISGTPMPSIVESFVLDEEIDEIKIKIEDEEELTAEEQKKYDEAMAEIRKKVWHLTNYVRALSRRPGFFYRLFVEDTEVTKQRSGEK
ncbi:MAG: c-type cytochrome [bacterium]